MSFLLAVISVSNDPTMHWDPAASGANYTFSNGDLTATKITADNYLESLLRGTRYESSGKWYWEINLDDTTLSTPDNFYGISNSTEDVDNPSGTTTDSYGLLQSTGETYHNSVLTAYGVSTDTGDVLGIAWDADNGRLFYAKNNTWMNSGDPAAGTNPAFTGISGSFTPSGNLLRAAAYIITAAFKASDQTYSPPSGFSAIG